MENNEQIPGQMSIYDFPEYLPEYEYTHTDTHNKKEESICTSIHFLPES